MTGIIILAAGSSSRLGRPKQNLIYKGKTLLQHTVLVAINSPCRPIIVVLGAYSETIHHQIDGEDIHIIYNPEWEQGMSGSIKQGINQLQATPQITGAIILLCDQPFVNHHLLSQMLQKQTETRKGIVACAYNNTLGVPVWFHQNYFAALVLLQGNEGAKKLLSIYADDIAVVDFPQGAIDIDTADDYEGLMGSNL
jgi:molybdenum cofactor cytidylyltransferase